MFTPSRYIVVDDEAAELKFLVDALHGLGAPCLGIHYTGRPLDPQRFSGVRILFSDLHLIPGAGKRQQFNAIEALLRLNIDPTRGGPYLFVLWTSHEDEVPELQEFLADRLDAEKRPIAVIGLDKRLYIPLAGEPPLEDLPTAIAAKIEHSPQLIALVRWETDVLAAAGATMAEICGLVPPGEREPDAFSQALDGVLSRLAAAAVGVPNVARDPRSAINAALVPMLGDRIANARVGGGDADIWDRAITRQGALPAIDDVQVGRTNRVLHLGFSPAERIEASDWGAVVALPATAQTEAAMRERFGLPLNTIMNDVFRIGRADRPRCQPILIRIGAVCDHAQKKPGPLVYVLGLLVPVNVERRPANDQKAELECPVILADNADGPVRLFVNARFQVSVGQAPPDWAVLFRIREQLLTMIAAHVSEYVTRPGIVKLPN